MRQLVFDSKGEVLAQKPVQMTFQTVGGYQVKAALLGVELGMSLRGLVEMCLDQLWAANAPTRERAQQVNEAFRVAGGARKAVDLNTPGVDFAEELEQMEHDRGYLRGLGIPEDQLPTNAQHARGLATKFAPARAQFVAQVAQPEAAPEDLEQQIAASGDGAPETRQREMRALLSREFPEPPTAYPLFDLEAMEERERAAMTPDFPEPLQ